MYKALISDFDNTLTGKNLPINDKTAAALHSLIQKGIHFAIATGRPFSGEIANECKRLSITTPQIVCGGSVIIKPENQEVLFAEYIPESTAREIVQNCKDQSIVPIVQNEKTNYTPNAQTYRPFGANAVFKDLLEVDYTKIVQIDLSPYLVKFPQGKAVQLKESFIQKHTDIHISLVKFEGYFGLNITSLKASKHVGVLEWMKLMNVDAEEVVGIGDGYNDYPLLTACGYKVAMGDAPDELKEIADLVVPAQKEDGVVKAITTVFGM